MDKLCECGCGGEVKSVKRSTRFINGHYPRVQSEETRHKRSETLKGRVRTEEHSRHISEALKGKSSPNKGRVGWFKHTEEFRRKMSERQLGEKHHMFGKHMNPETKMKLSTAKKGQMAGEKHHNWKGGISKFPYSQDWTDDLKDAIRKRDGYKCQLCIGTNGDTSLDVHHIDYDKENCDPKNLISLCKNCHSKTNYNRDKWIRWFNNRAMKNKQAAKAALVGGGE